MTDVKGNTVKVGDTVAYILGAKNSPHLCIGQITKIYPDDTKCSVNNHPNIFKSRILLYDPQKTTKTQTIQDEITNAMQEELTKAIQVLQDYCKITECSNCKITTAIKCGYNGISNIPSSWEPEEII